MGELATVDRGLCRGSGLCVAMAPETFQLGDDGLAQVHRTGGALEPGHLQDVADCCPTGAITVVTRSATGGRGDEGPP